MKYRKKPVVIDAVQWDGRKYANKPEWLCEAIDAGKIYKRLDVLDIVTSEGTMTAQPGDWIIQGVEGELYPCKPSIFEKTYETLDPSQERAYHEAERGVDFG